MKLSRLVRERRIERHRGQALRPRRRPRRGQRGQGTAQGQELLVPQLQPGGSGRAEQALQGPEVGGGHGRGLDPAVEGERDLAVGEVLETLGEPLVELEAHAERAQDLRTRLADEDGDGHHLEDAVRARPERRRLPVGERLPYPRQVGPVAAGRVALPDPSEQAPGAVDDDEEGRAHLAPIVPGQGLDRRRVGEIDRGLETGQVGHEARHAQRALDLRLVMLVDQPGRFFQPALQLAFRLPRHAHVDDGDGHADGEDGQGGAGQEDPVREGGEQLHESTKLTSTSPPCSGIFTDSDLTVNDGCQTDTV